MSKTIENLKSGNYEIVDNQGVSVTIHFIECLEKEFADLKTKLAESDAEIEKVENFYMKQKEYYVKEFNEVIDELKQQLAEKEKENNELVFIIEEIEQFAWEQLNNENFDRYKAYDEILTKIKQLTRDSLYDKQHQDKISFAVTELIKFKETLIKFLQEEGFYENEWYDLFDKIDQQIEKLEEKK